jgi:hypothetical protein
MMVGKEVVLMAAAWYDEPPFLSFHYIELRTLNYWIELCYFDE